MAEPQSLAPPCRHFGQCGGCTAQHLTDTDYATWKHGLVAGALARAGFDASIVSPLQRTPPGDRRRFDFAARRIQGGIALGLHASGSDVLVDIAMCPVLEPRLERLLEPLRILLRGLACVRGRADVAANLYDEGPDLLLRLEIPPNAQDRIRLAAFAEQSAVARIAYVVAAAAAEAAVVRSPPSIRFAGVTVRPPPGAFLQASSVGEGAIVAAVLAGLPRKLPARARIIELFAGIGTLSFPLATVARVLAIEGNAEAAVALRHAAGGTRVEAVRRDLARQPLQKAEFSGAAAVVLDPPYAGAAAQMPPLAAADVPRIIYVSCNPTTLARDARTLRAAGYRLVAATPIDQFLWSDQVEAVCTFEK